MYLGKVYIYKGITRPYKLNLKYNTLERSYKIESQLNLFNKEESQLGDRIKKKNPFSHISQVHKL